ncbi:MAG: hypothetical protein LAN71_09500, partial [Acidobacteriia bacterium]|nr:hypothetical protein [Terriglobia bacterium]
MVNNGGGKRRITKSKPIKKLTVERDIRFFRADLGSDPGTSGMLDLSKVFARVDKLPYVKDGRRYSSVDDENSLSSWVYSASDQRISLGTIRHSGLPLVESGGVLKGLGLTDDQGLCERTHIQVFPNNIVGVVFNFYGPRVSQLNPYLVATDVRSVPVFKLDPLLREDAAIQLNHVSVIRSLELSIRPSY